VEDAEAAIRLLRGRAHEWGIAPDRIGKIGFSAGGSLGLSLGVSEDADVRPNFIASIYTPMQTFTVPAYAPPMFAAVAFDDGAVANGFGLIDAWRAAGRPVELHVYERGGHGFGVPGVANTTTVHMMDEFLWWMQARGLLERNAASSSR
jgi:acetyl esterase/lipase